MISDSCNWKSDVSMSIERFGFPFRTNHSRWNQPSCPTHVYLIHSFIRNTMCPSDVSSWRWDERKRHDESVHRSSVSCCQHPPDDSHSRSDAGGRERISISPSVLPVVSDVGASRSNRTTAFSSFRDRYWSAPASLYRADVGGLRLDAGCLLSSIPRRERDREIERDRNARGRRGESGR